MSPNATSRYGESVAPVKGSVTLGFVDVAACTFVAGGTNGAVFPGGFGFVGAAGGRNGAVLVVVVAGAIGVVAAVVVAAATGGLTPGDVAVVPVWVASTCVEPVVGVVSVVAVVVVTVVVVGVVSVVGVGVVCWVAVVGVKQSPGPKPASSQPGLGHG